MNVRSFGTKLKDLADLDLPLKSNPLFIKEFRRAKSKEYAKIANLTEEFTRKLADLDMDLNDAIEDESTFNRLIEDGTINEKQKQDLELVISLGRLTGDNLPFVKLLKSDDLKSVSDLVRWDKEDWKEIMVSNQIQLPPEEESIDTYIENMMFNIETTFPSQSLISALTKPKVIDEKLKLLDSTNMLLEKNALLVPPDNRNGDKTNQGVLDNLIWPRVDKDRHEKIKKDLDDLREFTNSYKHIRLADIVNNSKITIEEKKNSLQKRIKLLDTFNRNNPQVDLRLVDFFDEQAVNETLNWTGIDQTDRPLVRKQEMAYQRVLELAEDSDTRQALLRKGYDSAIAVVRHTETEFIRSSGLPVGKARLTYAKAQETAVWIAHSFETMRNSVHGNFNDFNVGNVDPGLVNDLRRIDGFNDLFGSQNYCVCKECSSILGPAAYFADLMYYIDKNVSRLHFSGGNKKNHPLSLKRRRPDLWKLKLTCENTHTLTTYLTIVNDVLQSYLQNEVLESSSSNIFEELSKTTLKDSFSFPFNLPLEELRLYLSHFGITLHGLYSMLKEPEEKIWRSRISISAEELHVITTADLYGIKFRFGEPPNLFSNYEVQEFLRKTSLSRGQLDELLAITFNEDIRNIRVIQEEIPDELQNFPEKLKYLDQRRLDFIHRFIRLWRKTPWSIPDLDLVLSSLKDSGLLSRIMAEGVEMGAGGTLPPQATHALDKKAVLLISQLIDIQETLGLTTEELVSMFGPMPNTLFNRLFDTSKLFWLSLVPVMRFFEIMPPGTEEVVSDPTLPRTEAAANDQPQADMSVRFYHHYFDTTDPNDNKTDGNTPILSAGLGISETELLSLLILLQKRFKVPFNDNGYCTLDKEEISLLYRHAKLAKAMKLSIIDFTNILNLSLLPTDEDEELEEEKTVAITKISQIQKVIKFKTWLDKSPFNNSDLLFILKGTESSTVKYSVDNNKVASIILEVKQNRDDVMEEDEHTEDEIEIMIRDLKENLSRLFNIKPDNLDIIFNWLTKEFRSFEIVKALKTEFIDGEPTMPENLNGLLDASREIERILLLFEKLKLGIDRDIAFITNDPDTLGIQDLRNLNIGNIKSLSAYTSLLKLVDKKTDPAALPSTLSDYKLTKTFSSKNIKSMADLLKYDSTLISTVIKTLSFSDVAIEALEYVWRGLKICDKLGINGLSLRKLGADSTFTQFVSARDIAIGAFASKYENEIIRNEKLEPYIEEIDVIKRDALCDYIIAREKDLKFKDKTELYAFFLLDVEMSSCFKTSKVVAAISSLQLYIDRILIHLEQSDPNLNPGIENIQVSLSEEKQREWEWRKNFRVWQANRKVFLYPENYLEPDLRDNKSQIFRDLENDLLQQEVTMEAVETAYRNYMNGFTELAHVKIAGIYYQYGKFIYHIFGCTQQDPPRYYYRRWYYTDNLWSPWEKVDLAINSNRISAVIFQGKLFLFWVVNTVTEQTKIVDGNSCSPRYIYKYELKFSHLNEQGRWTSPQTLKIFEKKNTKKRVLKPNNAVFPVIRNSKIYITQYIPEFKKAIVQPIDFFRNELGANDAGSSLWAVPAQFDLLRIRHEFEVIEDPIFKWYYLKSSYLSNFVSANKWYEADIEHLVSDRYPKGRIPGNVPLLEEEIGNYGVYGFSITDNIKDLDPELHVVGHRPGDFILKLGNQQYLIRHPVSYPRIIGAEPAGGYQRSNLSQRVMVRLTTSVADEIAEKLFVNGLESFLSLKTQEMPEKPVGTKFKPVGPLVTSPPWNHPKHLDFEGAYGVYYEELFFQIPFLIADHLNSNQKFKEAEWWYKRIFNPTSSEEPGSSNPVDRNWQYIKFRNLSMPTLREVLTDEKAIRLYKEDPFNPHAIARVRLTAYQKRIVMKYVDNLIDWGDHLFAQDTMESINEATMLYTLASNILGERPAELGTCKIANDSLLSYEKIGPVIDEDSEFLIMLENSSVINSNMVRIARVKSALPLSSVSTPVTPRGPVVGNLLHSLARERAASGPRFENAGAAVVAGSSDTTPETFARFRSRNILSTLGRVITEKKSYLSKLRDLDNHVDGPQRVLGYSSIPMVDMVRQQSVFTSYSLMSGQKSRPVFCVPSNADLLEYWDRVKDRLFKIHNCMNISGVRRQLALFSPPINPMLLVKARAAGLSLEEAVELTTRQPTPSYRFTYLLEKAKQFTQTVQSFGSTLLSTLEKKDAEELTLLRSVHEQNILQQTRQLKTQQLEEAGYQYQAIVEAETNVKNRVGYYDGLINGGLTGWEATQQVSQHVASTIRGGESVIWMVAALVSLVPNAGSPFAMTYGGRELNKNASAFALFFENLAKLADTVSASAGLEASFQRREQEWKYQKTLAEQEIKQVEQQKLAAEIRKAISEKDIEIHDKHAEQTRELDDFYKGRFTNLGLYDYLSISLNRLYREAYNMALDLARKAEQAYRFEIDVISDFIRGDNWQTDRAGLLAGERLLLQLQNMEKAYYEAKDLKQNRRDTFEVSQTFSLAMLNPAALINLRQIGSTGEFEIPESAFELVYPGGYRRLIKSVAITVPCVVGPHTNIGAKLTLTSSRYRKDPTPDVDLETPPNPGSSSIMVSHARNDTGMFEIEFRGERYLPFEGAGAISNWVLELPKMIRSFDYDTISDVLIHISYTFKEDFALKNRNLNELEQNLLSYASSPGLFRLISLRHEFPTSLHRLLESISESEKSTEFETDKRYFPYFLAEKELDLTSVECFIQYKTDQLADNSDLDLKINSTDAGRWTVFGKNMKKSSVAITGNPSRRWTLEISGGTIDNETVEDIFLLLQYTAS